MVEYIILPTDGIDLTLEIVYSPETGQAPKVAGYIPILVNRYWSTAHSPGIHQIREMPYIADLTSNEILFGYLTASFGMEVTRYTPANCQ